MGTAHERTPVSAVRQVVQLYRECDKLLRHAVLPSLSALSNMTAQMHVVATALQRRGFVSCTTQQPSSSSLCEATSCSSPSSHTAYAVAAAPLGVLAAFPASVTEHMTATYTRDRTALLHSMAEAQQRWHHNTQQMQQCVTLLEQAWCAVMADAPSSHAAAYAATAAAQLCSDEERRLTGLQTRSQVLAAVYSVLGAVARMDSVLQECVLALRHDVLHTTLLTHTHAHDDDNDDDTSMVDARDSRAAHALAALYDREGDGDSSSCARAACRVWPLTRTAALHSSHDDKDKPAWRHVRDDTRHIDAVLQGTRTATTTAAAQARATSLCVALDTSASFVEVCWRHTTRAFLCEEAHILLS